ncbi:2TM domain-containing protein [Hymenobacter sp. BT175]|uniref:2TM domain-containing protein n=1 Tax=Hymenobacter translucens TaxID=2886507 RepID=UPI001D0DF488|nr:2TM domain-containing protein [Hymenobacter translucens]MCC2547754.1 2TM domain-containing protein [Hymenobacter translucens]
MEASNRDPQLWRMAKSRAKFKSHLFTYLAVNSLLWIIWALTDRHTGGHGNRYFSTPWPLWSTAFWGFGVLMNGIGTYGGFGRSRQSEREYERLVRQRAEGSKA